MKRVTIAFAERMVSMYNSGIGSHVIGKELGFSSVTVRNHLRKNNVQIRDRDCRSVDYDTSQRIVALYSRGMSSIGISKIMPYSSSAIRDQLRKNGVKIRKSRKLTNRDRERIKELYYNDVKAAEIARLYKIHQNTVYRLASVDYYG